MALTDDIARKLSACAVPTINAVMAKSGLGSNHMRQVAPVGPARRFVGRAVTLRAIPTREDLKKRVAAGELPDLQARAFAELGQGDVLVIEAGGDLRASVFGDIMATYAMVRGAAGIVIDGCVSDQEAIAKLDLPVFARGNAATSASLFLHFTEMGGPVGCDGVGVMQGDILVGDGNGVVLVPAAHAQAVADAAFEREEFEAYIVDRIKAGAPLIGTYPPNEATREAYRRFREGR
ncbi:ribonuclease activity regulator RraA [Roseomonas sp. AR75]|jgi:regulator of RNase E activity RraA|uniref:RraA family protein n=1 Tax=Roseomonas sp. AR75 TaxID=2562311 RepID=UPI0010BF8052|nr:ribonuclease activity regulator RraA [Roseomonas sp. AR75]